MKQTIKNVTAFSSGKRVWVLLFIFAFYGLSPLCSMAQEKAAAAAGKGVQFQDDLSWAAVKAKARAENKYIFVDGYTTWCGPCKYMKNSVFPQEESGVYFNAKFISVGVQLDTTKADNAFIQGWYKDAHAIMQEYHINAFPTFLIFTPDGRVVHRVVGGSNTAAQFIARVQDCFNPEKQYYTQLHKFQAGDRDSSFLRKMAMMARDGYDLKNAEIVAKAYFATQMDLFNPGTLALLNDFTTSTKDQGFAIFYHHPAEVDKVLGSGMAEKKVRDILVREYVYARVLTKTSPATPDWKAIQSELAAHYPTEAPEVLSMGKVAYYQRKNDWNNFQVVVVDYMKKYGSAANAQQLNDYAWTVFQHCPDMNCVTEALDWSKRSFKDNNEPAFMDTYANILYKMGKKDDAITWEEKARDMSSAEEKKGFQETIDKMKKGEKTWE
ncbi:MAG TPA: thioredoxin fold domain-containing protein [Puia sp.]|jgi:thiol-disulfide isomerase/thioredoxin